MDTVEIIVPCYNEEAMIDTFYAKTKEVVSKIKNHSFSFIFVNDGSKDKTLTKIKELEKNNKDIKYISFSRNFGKEAAMYAGLKNATADKVIIMDADLQHSPERIEEMIKAIDEEGYDASSVRRISRKGEPKIKSFFAKLFYKIINKISDINIVSGALDFIVMKKQMVNVICSMAEHDRFTKGIFNWVGFDIKWFETENINRVAGETKWSFWSLFKYAITGFLSFSTFPLKLGIIFGLLMMVISFIMGILQIIFTIFNFHYVSNISVLTTVVLLVGGLLSLLIGILGLYISNILVEVKNRPIYIIKDTNIKGCEK